MKKIITASFVLLSALIVNAQQTPQPAQKPQSLTVPEFHILKADSASYYTNSDLKKHHETIIMYFSPECDHCKHQTKDILDNMDKFKNVEIVMATYFALHEMKDFYEHYKIADYPNIKMGRDEKYAIPPHYNMHSFPFLALYDKNGKLITTFEGNQKADTLLNAFKRRMD